MTKFLPTDETLKALWTVKDETAARFKSVGEYFAYLKAPAPKQARPSLAKSAKSRRRVKAKAI
jgi:hypothetical protein